MGLVFTEITLKNATDIILAKKSSGGTGEVKIRQKTIEAMVDTGAWTLVINEALKNELGLDYVGQTPTYLADGTESWQDMAGPVEVHWKNRRMICDALVLPGAKDPLLGAIPMEALDLMVHPKEERVVGVHGDQMIHVVY